MTNKKYVSVGNKFAKFVGWIFIIILSFGYAKGVFNLVTLTNDSSQWIFFLIVSPIAVVIMIFNMYSFPAITVSDQGLMIEFLWRYYDISWEQIRSVKKFRMGIGKVWFVECLGLSPFHYLYGISFPREFARGFYISPSTKDFDELIELLNSKIKN